MRSRHTVLAGVGVHPGRSQGSIAVNTSHDNPEFKQLRVSFLKSCGHPGGGAEGLNPQTMGHGPKFGYLVMSCTH